MWKQPTFCDAQTEERIRQAVLAAFPKGMISQERANYLLEKRPEALTGALEIELGKFLTGLSTWDWLCWSLNQKIHPRILQYGNCYTGEHDELRSLKNIFLYEPPTRIDMDKMLYDANNGEFWSVELCRAMRWIAKHPDAQLEAPIVVTDCRIHASDCRFGIEIFVPIFRVRRGARIFDVQRTKGGRLFPAKSRFLVEKRPSAR